MMELAYIYSLVSRAILLCSMLIGHRGSVVAQSAADSARPAHPAGENGARAHFELRVLTARLMLTSEQQMQVRSALAEQEQAFVELREEMRNDPNAVGAEGDKLRAIRQATDATIAALLSDEQKAGFAMWVAERNAAMEHPRHRHQEEAPPARDAVDEPLSLI